MGPETGGLEGSNPVLEALERLEQKSSPPPPQTSSARWAGLGFFALLMFSGIGLVSWYLSTTAQARYPEVPDDPLGPQDQEQVETEDNGFAELEIELREALARRTDNFDVSRGPQVEKNDQDGSFFMEMSEWHCFVWRWQELELDFSSSTGRLRVCS